MNRLAALLGRVRGPAPAPAQAYARWKLAYVTTRGADMGLYMTEATCTFPLGWPLSDVDWRSLEAAARQCAETHETEVESVGLLAATPLATAVPPTGSA